ncbi:hypothetical protein BKA62DRAFT_729354 [Auriculariales sp. MPI-PUGE-AT-0066]|nr:hypothetical protein BKA62DRAFT_729354 [Auriculariales sp. MPI-PUGE-AT-0066]
MRSSALTLFALALPALAQFSSITNDFDDGQSSCFGNCEGDSTWYKPASTQCQSVADVATRQTCFCAIDDFTNGYRVCLSSCLGSDTDKAISTFNSICGTTGSGTPVAAPSASSSQSSNAQPSSSSSASTGGTYNPSNGGSQIPDAPKGDAARIGASGAVAVVIAAVAAAAL